MFYLFVINTSSIRYFKLWNYVFISMLSNSAFWKSCISQYFFIPLCAENYLRAFGAKMRQKEGRAGSQSWIVFPFSVFCRVVSCPLLDLRRQLWMWVLRSHWLSGWECCALIGRLHELLLEDCNWVWQHETLVSNQKPYLDMDKPHIFLYLRIHYKYVKNLSLFNGLSS